MFYLFPLKAVLFTSWGDSTSVSAHAHTCHETKCGMDFTDGDLNEPESPLKQATPPLHRDPWPFNRWHTVRQMKSTAGTEVEGLYLFILDGTGCEALQKFPHFFFIWWWQLGWRQMKFQYFFLRQLRTLSVYPALFISKTCMQLLGWSGNRSDSIEQVHKYDWLELPTTTHTCKHRRKSAK